MLDVGVIGAGAIAQEAYLPAIREMSTARVSAVVDVDETRARSTAARFDAADHHTNPDAIKNDIDAVVIATPPRYHADLAETFLSNGVAVMTEKPVATNSERGKELLDMAEREDLDFAISRQLREAPGVRLIRDFYNVGSIGTPLDVTARFGDETEWSFASDYRLRKNLAWGGVLTDKAPHVLDALIWMFGSDVRVRRYRDDSLGGLEANAEIQLRFREIQDCPVSVEVTSDRGIRNEITLRGDEGTLRADPNGSYAVFTNDVQGPVVLQPVSEDRRGRFRPRVAKQLERFLIAVNGGPNTYVSAKEGVHLLSLIESCYEQRQPLRHSWERIPQRVAIRS